MPNSTKSEPSFKWCFAGSGSSEINILKCSIHSHDVRIQRGGWGAATHTHPGKS